jgi:hypothetical protein
LYSGQLVAQSELSVVMTLAPIPEMEGGVDHAGLYALGHRGAQYRLAGTAFNAHPVTIADAAILGIMRWISSLSSPCHWLLGVRRVCAPTLYCENAPGGQQQRKALRDLLVRGHILGDDETALATHEFSLCMMAVPASSVPSLQGHCTLPRRSIFS